jgi:predicted MFS family arabinose efflux permease
MGAPDVSSSGEGPSPGAPRGVRRILMPMPSTSPVAPRERSGLRVLTLTTLQQAGLTSVRFGLPILAPFWRDAFHLSLGQVGVLLGAFDLGALLLFIPIGLLADRWGESVVLSVGALFTAAMTALITLAQSFWSLALLLAIAGLGYGSGQTAGTKAVAAAFGSVGRAMAMGIRQSGLPLGGIVAALLLPPLLGMYGWQAAIAGAAGACAIPGVLCWVGLREDAAGRPEAPPRQGPGTIMDRVREIAGNGGVRRTTEAAMLLVLVQFCYQGYLALYLVDHFGWSNRAAALLLAAVHLGGVVGRVAWGACSDRGYGGRRVPALAWCTGAGVLFPFVLIVLGHTAPPAEIALVAFIGGTLLLGWNGLYTTLITESAGPGLGATAMGVSMTLLYLTTMVAPPLFGVLVDHTSYAVGWASLVGVMVVALAVTYRIPEPVAPAR